MLDFLTPQLLVYVGIVGIVFLGLQMGAAVMVYAERKVAAYMQQRMGPTLVGPAGLLQPIADIVKLIFKEDLRPKAADTALFLAAPVISVAAAYVAFAPIPVWRGVDVLRPARSSRCRCWWRTSTSRCSRRLPSRRWAFTASCSRAGRATASIRCSAGCAARRR